MTPVIDSYAFVSWRKEFTKLRFENQICNRAVDRQTHDIDIVCILQHVRKTPWYAVTCQTGVKLYVCNTNFFKLAFKFAWIAHEIRLHFWNSIDTLACWHRLQTDPAQCANFDLSMSQSSTTGRCTPCPSCSSDGSDFDSTGFGADCWNFNCHQYALNFFLFLFFYKDDIWIFMSHLPRIKPRKLLTPGGVRVSKWSLFSPNSTTCKVASLRRAHELHTALIRSHKGTVKFTNNYFIQNMAAQTVERVEAMSRLDDWRTVGSQSARWSLSEGGHWSHASWTTSVSLSR